MTVASVGGVQVSWTPMVNAPTLDESQNIRTASFDSATGQSFIQRSQMEEAGSSFGMSSIGRVSSMSTINYEDIYAMDQTSTNNDSIKAVEKRLYAVRPGKVVISNRPSDKSNSIIISENGVTITTSNMANGFSVTNDGVNVQGPTYFSGKGTMIHKGEFTENPNSSNEFTYHEVVDFTTIPETLKPIVDTFVPDGEENILGELCPLITDIAPGPTPHSHTISMKHKHRLDPAYLYRLPRFVDVIKGAKGAVSDFLSEKSGFSDATRLVGTVE